MQECSLHILSSVDGETKQFRQDGEFFVSDEKTEIRYMQEGSSVCILITADGTLIERKGEYELSLLLREGQKTLGKIGLGTSFGNVEISTKKILCQQKDVGVSFSAEYALHFGAELQRMKLRIKVNKKG